MGRSDLQWVVKIPTPACPKCHKEGVETIGGLINRDQIACGFCSNVIDLTSEDWRAYLKEAIDAVGKMGGPYDKLP